MTLRIVEAVVQSGAAETQYLRGGNGPPVLLLKRGSLADISADPLFAALAAEFRVIAPEFRPAPNQGRLGEIIDGLGLDRPSVVIEAGFRSMLAEVLAVAAERLDRVILLEPNGKPADVIHRLRQERRGGRAD